MDLQTQLGRRSPSEVPVRPHPRGPRQACRSSPDIAARGRWVPLRLPEEAGQAAGADVRSVGGPRGTASRPAGSPAGRIPRAGTRGVLGPSGSRTGRAQRPGLPGELGAASPDADPLVRPGRNRQWTGRCLREAGGDAELDRDAPPTTGLPARGGAALSAAAARGRCAPVLPPRRPGPPARRVSGARAQPRCCDWPSGGSGGGHWPVRIPPTD